MKQGFTLIELLVVVLIIGILSAVALPKYETVVWNSRARLLQTAVKQVADAQERYILANGTCAFSFEELDISFDSLPYKVPHSNDRFLFYPLRAVTDDGVRGNDDFEIALGSFAGYEGRVCWTLGRFKRGPWKSSGLSGEGFAVPHYEYRLGTNTPHKKLYCAERKEDSHRFCQILLHMTPDQASSFTPSTPGNRLYPMN